MAHVKFADWPDKAEAAKMIKVSVKTLERMARAGEIEQKMRPRPGRSPVAVFNPSDIQRKASEKAAEENRVFVLPANSGSGVESTPDQEGTALTISPSLPIAPNLSHAVEMLARALSEPRPEPLHILTMDDAAKLGYPRKWLREQIKEGKLRKFGRRVSRFELERLAGRG